LPILALILGNVREKVGGIKGPNGKIRGLLDNPKNSLIIHDSPLHLAPLGEPEERDGFNSDNQCGIFVESKDTFIEGQSFDEPFIVEFSEVTPLEEDLIPFMLSLPLT